MRVTALAPWFGSNRMLGAHVGAQLAGCSWVGIPFAGGMAEVPHITARTLLVNDLHRHVINLARVVANDDQRRHMIKRLARLPFHPEVLQEAQELCKIAERGMPPDGRPSEYSLGWGPYAPAEVAAAYFVCCWMGRSSKAGIDDEFNGRPAIRWTSDGGDSMVRYRSAVRSLAEWGRTLKRCTFETMDAFDFLARCEDRKGHGVYADPPFPGKGQRYKHNAGKTASEELAWHTRLRDALARFGEAVVVCRFYEHPMIRELYPEGRWHWLPLEGRKQTNESAEEVLVLNRPPLTSQQTLFV